MMLLLKVSNTVYAYQFSLVKLIFANFTSWNVINHLLSLDPAYNELSNQSLRDSIKLVISNKTTFKDLY